MERLDEITLTGVRARGFHGVYPEERRDGQEFVVDVTVRLPLSDAGDDVAGTIHYGELAEGIVAAIERDPVDLIETLAERIADLVLGYPLAHSVTVTVQVDTRPAAASDDVADTVHYGEVAEAVTAIVEGEPVDLLETLCARIADAVLAFAPVQAVAVTVHKPSAPIAVPFGDVSVTVRRAGGAR
jgi:7,8-dihydroneopterin aldolase/epimerase/oxygenase